MITPFVGTDDSLSGTKIVENLPTICVVGFFSFRGDGWRLLEIVGSIYL